MDSTDVPESRNRIRFARGEGGGEYRAAVTGNWLNLPDGRFSTMEVDEERGVAGSWPATNFRPLAARLMSIIVNLFRGIYHRHPAPGHRIRTNKLI